MTKQTLSKHTFIFPFLLSFLLSSCTSEKSDAIFTELSVRSTGIDFRNLIKEDENFNIFQYQYYYNGGGVAVADFNNDGLEDIVFTGNMVKNRMYVNQGNMEFKDITKQSRIAEKEGWCTGVVPIDINEDGWLDLYICRAGYPFKELRKNLLFINNKDLTFTEKAAEYGIDDHANATQSSFFDYDNDGDLDLFLLNHSTLEYSQGNLEIFKLKNKKDPEFTNKLYRNDNGHFTNVTEEAEITSNVLTFSLGISVSDINDDGWSDIFIGNDFNEPDYLFINQKDGTFKDELESYFDHTSMFTMGSDIADFNNDGLLDLVSLDMLPESNFLQKMHSGVDNFDKVVSLEKNDFYRQYSRNMLQLNNGDNTFSEVSQLSGVSNTDWSWTPLFFDFDNDGNKDLFIANGYLRDHTDMDFLTFTANEVMRIKNGEENIDFEGYLNKMPPILQPNYFYQNQGNLHFENKAKDWDLDAPIVTQSAAYSDLDNDGDLDLVLNNSGDYAKILQNNSERINQNNYLKIKLLGEKNNPSGIGSKVRLYSEGKVFYQEQYPVRGFQSCMSSILNFGLNKIEKIDKIIIDWASGEQQILKNVNTNQEVVFNIKNAKINNSKELKKQAFFVDKNLDFGLLKENNFNDFKSQTLLPYFYSREGHSLISGDVNNDGKEDIFVGGAKGSLSQFFLQKEDGSFRNNSISDFNEYSDSEDIDAALFDADNDNDLDLYIAKGGYEFEIGNPDLQDQLFLNNGRGNFTLSKGSIPSFLTNSSCVQEADFDKDGDLDLFVGGGVKNGAFPESYSSYLLVNDGKGQFSIQEELAIEGITKEAIWVDLNSDDFPELIIVGEWMEIVVYENEKGKLTENTSQYFPENNNGLWQTIHAADFDNDGDMDLMTGNLGTNSQLTAETNEPLEIFFGDYDENGSIDPIICYYNQGKSYPLASRDDMLQQLPHLKKKFLFFKPYAEAQIQNILTPEQLEKTKKNEVHTLETTYWKFENGHFIKHNLPVQSQFAPVRTIHSTDINHDGHLDLILAGNKTHTRVKLGRLDGNHGQVLLGNAQGEFRLDKEYHSGLGLKEETTAIEEIEVNGESIFLFLCPDKGIEVSKLNK